MRVLIYADTKSSRKLRDKLRAERHSAILCNPEFYAPADLREAEVVYFPEGHRLAEQVAADAADKVQLEWIKAPSKKDAAPEGGDTTPVA
jgi:hypothetical protein